MKKRDFTFMKQIIAGGLTAALLLSGCGSASGSTIASTEATSNGAGTAMGYDEEMADYESVAAADTSDVYSNGSVMEGGLAPDVSGAPSTNRKLIRNISLEVETQDFSTLIANVTTG